MFSGLLLSHPVEMMVATVLIDGPAIYLAYTLVAYVHSERRETFGLSLKGWLVLIIAGGLFGLAAALNRVFVSPYYNLNGDLWAYAMSDMSAFITCFVSALVIGFIRNAVTRAVLSALGLGLYLVMIENFPTAPVFAIMEWETYIALFATCVFAALLMSFGAALMTIKSHVGRGVAVMSSTWGIKLVAFAMLSANRPSTSLFTTTVGIITPTLIVAMTLMLLFGVGIAYLELRRLNSTDYKRGMLAESEERMRLLAEASQEAILVERRGILEDSNPVFRKITGYPAPAGMKISDIIHDRRIDDGASERERGLICHDGLVVPVNVHSNALGNGRIVHAMQDLTYMRRSQARIRKLAETDGLTGLANRHHFDSVLEGMVETASANEVPHEGRPLLALMMIDLDRFKPVNDTYGHAAGDTLLRALATKMTAGIRDGDIVARIGGDEFAIAAWVRDEADGAGMAERICAAATEPFLHENVQLTIGASVGIAYHDTCCDVLDAASLRSGADLALYEAKESGRGRVVRFEQSMAEDAQAKLKLERDLRSALRNGEISLHYQMQQDLRSGRTVGYEALMRWTSPDLGSVPPLHFIPIAEDTGVIVALGRWALMRAATDFAEFDGDTRVSVNVSPVQFETGNLVKDVKDALTTSGLAPERLELEITEQVLIEDTDATLEKLHELRGLGVSLSLDDFGSGYSSLAYLTRFPFSKIKIDRQFIDRMMSDERSHALVASMLALAGSLGLKVTAEGVETHGQLLHLAKGACDEAQGYLLGRPATLEDIRKTVEDGGAEDSEEAWISRA